MGHVTTLDGKLIQCLIDKSKSESFSSIKLDILYFCTKYKRFIKQERCVFKTTSHLSTIIKVSTCIDVRSGLQTILLHALCGHSNAGTPESSFVYLLNITSQSCVQLLKLDSYVHIKNHEIVLTDGPTIIWNCRGNVHMYSVDSEKLLLQNSVIETLLWSGFCVCTNSVIVFCYVNTSPTSNTREPTVLSLQLTSDNIYTKLNFQDFIPKEFCNLATINVTKITSHNVNPTVEFSSEILALSTEGFVIQMRNGEILWALPTSITMPCSSVLYPWRSFVLDVPFVAIYNLSSVIILDLKNKKMIQELVPVQHVCLEDFTNCGCSQLLLLTGDFSISENSGWMLTDKGVWHFDHLNLGSGDIKSKSGDIKRREGSDDYHDSIQPAIQALEIHLQNDLISYHEKCQVVNRERSDFILDTWNRLTSKHAHREYTNADHLQYHQQQSADLVIKEIWQRIVNECWVVGVDIINHGQRGIYALRLSVIPANQNSCVKQIAGKCGWICTEETRHHTLSSQQLCTGKRVKSEASSPEIRPQEKGTVYMSTSVPNFGASSEYTCELIVHWKEVMLEAKENKEKSLFCGTLTLNATHIVQNNYCIKVTSENADMTPKEMKRDFTALSATQQDTILEVKSTWSNLLSLGEWMKTKCGFQLIEGQGCHMTTLTPLSNLRVFIHPDLMDRRAAFTVCSKSEDQLFLFLHHIYSSLPDDIIILNHTNEITRQCISNALAAIKSEIVHLFDTKGKETPRQDAMELPEKDEQGALILENIHENFRKRKRDITESDASDVSKDMYMSLQQETDQLIAKLSML